MKYTKRGPCEHFDMAANCHRDACPDLMAAIAGDRTTNQCSYYKKHVSAEDVESDNMNRPCRVRREIPDDDKTIDIFEGGKS